MSSRKMIIMSTLECLLRLALFGFGVMLEVSISRRHAYAGSLLLDSIWMALTSLLFLELRKWDWRISFELEVDTTPMVSFSSPVEGGARRVYKQTS